MTLRVTILGSGTIIPSAGRHTTSLYVESGGENFLFDCGPGILDALEENGVSYRTLTRIFLTHFHPDHSLGIGHLLSAVHNDRLFPQGKRITCYGPHGLAELVGRWNKLFMSTISGNEYIEIIETVPGVVIDGDTRVIAAEAVHGDDAALAYRVEAAGSSVIYTGDSEYTESLVGLARGSDILVSECSFPDDERAPGHMTPSDVGALAAEAGVREVILVHIYPFFDGYDPVAAVRKHFTGSVTAASDGMTLDIRQ